LLTVIVLTIGFLTVTPLLKLLGAHGEYLKICTDYIHVILAGSGLPLTVYMFNAVLNAQGDMTSYRNFLIGATLLNIVLDPWFMFGGFGLPAMGIRGLALATLVAQFSGLLYMGWRARATGLLNRSAGAQWTPQLSILREITGQGVPASLNMMTVALGIFIITWFLSRFSENTVAAYGVATRIEQIVLMPTIGLNAATMSLVAQNGGARLFGRVNRIVRVALAYGAVATALGGVLLWFGGEMLMKFFTDDENVVSIGAHYLRIAAFIQYAYILLFVNTSALQGLKKPAFALWIGLYRQLVAPAFTFWFTTEILHWGVDGVWWSVFGVTWSAAVISVWWSRRLITQLERAEELNHG